MKSIELARKDMYVTVQKEGKTFLLTVEELISFFENSKKKELKMIEFETYADIPENFTGVCNVGNTFIYTLKNGKLNNKNGAAVKFIGKAKN